MAQFAVQRLVQAIPTFLIAMAIVFFSIRLIPGDELTGLIGEQVVGKEDRAALKKQLGLDAPLHEQYFEFVTGVFQGDLGQGTFDKQPVTEKVRRRMPVTIQLGIMSVIVASAIAIPVGVISAVKRNSPVDYSLRLVAIFALSIPSFWLATVILIFSAVWFNWVPPIGRTSIFEEPARNMEQFIIPSILLGAVLAGSLMRITRSQMLEVMREDYIRTARSKGLAGRVVIMRHAVRNALIPVVTVIGLQIAGLLGGSVVIESVFGLNGLGTLIISALDRRDYPVVQGVEVVIICIVITVNLAVDMSYAFIDPRLRHA